MSPKEMPRLGKLPRRYTFILNPYTDPCFTRCPGCDQKTKQRKLPLFIHVEPLNPIFKEVRTIERRPAWLYPADEPLVQDERAEKPAVQNKRRTRRKRKRSRR